MPRPTADQILDAFRVWEVKVQEYPGWRTRGRPGGTDPAGWRGVLEHHTGSGSQTDDYLKFLAERGRPEEGIPGPLCNASIKADGTVVLMALGRANHAGEGSSTTFAVVKNGAMPTTRDLPPGPDNMNGNPEYWGFEWMYDGKTPPPAAMYQAALRATAAIIWLMRRLNGGDPSWDEGRAAGHKEHTRRKLDPGKVPMGKFRTDLAAVLAAGPQGDDDMMTPEQMTELKNWIHTEVFAGPRYEALQSSINKVMDKAAEIDKEESDRYQREEQIATNQKTEADARAEQAKAEADARQQLLLQTIETGLSDVKKALNAMASAITAANQPQG